MQITTKTLNNNDLVHLAEKTPNLNVLTGEYKGDFNEVEARNLKVHDIIVDSIDNIREFHQILSVELIEEDKITFSYYSMTSYPLNTLGKYAHIVGNGGCDLDRSNAYALDWDGNGWFAGNVECDSIILRSSTEGSNKRFKITVDDSGTLITSEIIEE